MGRAAAHQPTPQWPVYRHDGPDYEAIVIATPATAHEGRDYPGAYDNRRWYAFREKGTVPWRVLTRFDGCEETEIEPCQVLDVSAALAQVLTHWVPPPPDFILPTAERPIFYRRFGSGDEEHIILSPQAVLRHTWTGREDNSAAYRLCCYYCLYRAYSATWEIECRRGDGKDGLLGSVIVFEPNLEELLDRARRGGDLALGRYIPS